MTLEDLVEMIIKDPDLETMGQFSLSMRENGEYGGYSMIPVSRVEIDHESGLIVFND